MYVEAFHHSLKYIYMKGFANRRVDKCVSLLMEFVKDKTFDRLVKLQKGKKSRRVNDIDSRHRLSLKLRGEDVKEVEVNRWEVRSTDGKRVYTVDRKPKSCQGSCHLDCKQCRVCVHEFSCTCLDGVVRGTLCKHVHLVVRSQGRLDHVGNNDHESYVTLPPAEEDLLRDLTAQTRQARTKVGKDKVECKLHEIGEQLGDVPEDADLASVYKHLDAALQLLRVSRPVVDRPFQDTGIRESNVPQRVTPQRAPFKSTKKPRNSKRVQLEKPTREERESIACSHFRDQVGAGTVSLNQSSPPLQGQVW
ncbi:uncharacterized protein [Diadema setosum]|uniref:uncharacterized protein n=1 Tax=Diadema setosum TaxID=31175 RepID=UPI003B3B7DA6